MNEWKIPEWTNVLKCKGLDPRTREFAEHRLEQLRESPGICYTDAEAYQQFKEDKER